MTIAAQPVDRATFTVAYLEVVSAASRALLERHLPGNFRLVTLESGTPEETLGVVGDADFLFITNRPLDARTIAAARRVRLIQHQGVGHENIDLAAARRAGIPVALNPVGPVAVAEHALMLMLAVLRRVVPADSGLRAGRWLRWELRPAMHDLAGGTVAIVGFGRNGRALAELLRPFRTRTFYTDPVPASRDDEQRLGVTRVSLDDALRDADVLSLHTPLSSATAGMIGVRELALMKPTAVLINTSRGELVDETALDRALREGRLGGAGLDVFIGEPLTTRPRFADVDSVVMTPHVAAGTLETYEAKIRFAYDNMQRALRGEAPLEVIGA